MDTIDDVEKILNGEVDIPSRVTNQMIMLAMKFDRNERLELEKRVSILEKWDKRLKVAWTMLAGVFGLDKIL